MMRHISRLHYFSTHILYERWTRRDEHVDRSRRAGFGGKNHLSGNSITMSSEIASPLFTVYKELFHNSS